MNITQIWNSNRKFALKIFICVWIFWQIFVTISAFMLPKTYLSIADVKVEISDAAAVREVMKSEALYILSPTVLNKVIANLNLNELWGKRYNGGVKLKPSDSLRLLATRINVAPAMNSPMISIMSYSESPEDAADIANALAEAYRFCRVEDQTNTSGKSVLPIVSVQLINRAEPNHRPCRPNIPLCIGLGIIVSAIYGAIAAVLAVGIKWLFMKLPVPKVADSNNNKSPTPRIVSKY